MTASDHTVTHPPLTNITIISDLVRAGDYETIEDLINEILFSIPVTTTPTYPHSLIMLPNTEHLWEHLRTLNEASEAAALNHDPLY